VILLCVKWWPSAASFGLKACDCSQVVSEMNFQVLRNLKIYIYLVTSKRFHEMLYFMLFFVNRDVSRIVLVADIFGGVQNTWDNGIPYLHKQYRID